MIDRHTDRMASLRNQVPAAVMALQIGAVAIGLGVLALYLSMLGRSLVTPLVEVQAQMDLPPAVGP